MSKPHSLVLITVDCLRADHVGFMGYGVKTTPFLDSLAESSMVFSQALVAGAPTYYSFPAIMASRHPLSLGRDVIGISPGESTIATTLRENGYSTAAFIAGNPYLSPRFGYDAGFDVFHDFLDVALPHLEINNAGIGDDHRTCAKQNDLPSPMVLNDDADPANSSFPGRINHNLARICRRLGPIGSVYAELYFRYCQKLADHSSSSLDSLRRFPSADQIVDKAIEWLDSVPEGPFFLWLHFMDPHAPYYPKAQALQWLGVETRPSQARYLNSYWNRGDLSARRLARRRKEVVALYDAGIRWVDAQSKRLVDELRRRKLWSNCVFSLTADHGEEFLDHGGRYHSPAKLTEELIHVPLLMHAPDTAPNRRTVPFSLVHLGPTLLDAMDIAAPDAFEGQSFWKESASRDETAIVESIGRCTNPFEASQRLNPRVLAIRESQFKLVFDFAGSEGKLFNLHSDPAELTPIPAEDEKIVRRKLLKRAHEHIAQSAYRRSHSPRLEAQLREIRLGLESRVNAISS